MSASRAWVGAMLLASGVTWASTTIEVTQRIGTLEDMQRDAGGRFQAAIGLATFEAGPGLEATPGFGLAVDDMVIEWAETDLEEDQTGCEASDGECAVVSLQGQLLFEGNAIVPVTIVDRSPYGAAGVNDCLLDGDFDPASFEHEARWNAAQSRIEMHLRCKAAVAIINPGWQ